MAEFIREIDIGMSRAKSGHLTPKEEVSSDNFGQIAFLEAFESYQDADVAFKDKCDEILAESPHKGSSHLDHNSLKIAELAAVEVMKERQLQRELSSSDTLLKWQQAIYALQAMENNVRVKEGVVRAASARMLASMDIAKEKEAGVRKTDFEFLNHEQSSLTVEFKVARQMQFVSQTQALAAVKDYSSALEIFQKIQEACDILESQAKNASVLAFVAKYVAEKADFANRHYHG